MISTFLKYSLYLVIFFFVFLISIYIFSITVYAQSLDDWSDDFESYNTGDINGQGFWSADSTFDVEDSPVRSGNRSLEYNYDGSFDVAQKTIGVNLASSTDIYYTYYQRRDSTSSDAEIGLRFGDTGGSAYCTVFMRGDVDGNDWMITGTSSSSVAPTSDITHTSNTWHKVVVHLDFTNDLCSATIDDSETIVDGLEDGLANDGTLTIARLGSASGNRKFYFDDMSISEQDPSIVPVTGNSFLNIIKPEQGTSTNSRTIDILISGGIDSDEVPDENIDKLYMDFSSQAYPTDDIERVVIAENITLDQQFEFSTTTTLNRDGHYLGLAYFTNGEDKVFVSEKVTFNSATTTLPVDIPLSNPQGLCEGGNFVEEGFCKVMVFLFYPSEEATDRFISLNDILDSKVPFGYFHLLDTKLNSISGTSTDPFSDFDVNIGTSTYGLGNIKIVDWSEAKDTIGQDNLDTIETWFVNLLWIIFGLYIAGRTFSFAQNQL